MKSASAFTVLALLALSTINSQLSTAHAQTPAGTVFTYDGKLQYGGSPVADGLYDFQFNLSNAPTGGNQVGSTLPKTAVPVTNGLFTTTLDFGAVFTGNATWLAISVCSNGVGNFQNLAPLQELTPAPYAIFAESSSNVSGTVSAAQLTSVGNTAFPNLYNFFIGPAGNPANTGGGNTAIGSSALPGISSGSGNTASGFNALDANGSGSFNTADGSGALQGNTIGSYNTAEGGDALYNNTTGSNNIALGFNAGDQITTGSSNIDIGNDGVSTDTNIIRIGNGQSQTVIAGVINGNGGGLTNLNAAQLTSVGNGNYNPTYNSPAGDNFFIGPAGNATTIGSGNTAIGSDALISNTSGAANTAIGGAALYFNTSGYLNTAVGQDTLFYNTSGYLNTAVGENTLSFNISGVDNTAIGAGALSSLQLGTNNIALGYNAGQNYGIGESDGGDESYNIDIGNFGVVGENNTIHIGDPTLQTAAYVAGIYGATPNQASATAVYVDANGQLGTVGPSGGGGGQLPGYVVTNNDTQPITLSALAASTLTLPAIIFDGNADVILSGTSPAVPLLLNDSFGNICVGLFAGHKLPPPSNTQPGGNTVVGAGALYQDTGAGDNTAIGFEALSNNVSGNNTAVGFLALSANKNGSGNIALGGAAGIAIVNGNNNIDIGNQGVAGDGGIIRIGTQGTQSACYLAGTVYANGVMLTSDRNAKENFSAVNARAVLAKVASLPVTEWNYKTDNKDVQHIGPMAQDFQAAFGLDGADDKHISVVDEGGVALAAIQGLNQKLEEAEQALTTKDSEIQELRQRLEALEKIVLTQKTN